MNRRALESKTNQFLFPYLGFSIIAYYRDTFVLEEKLFLKLCLGIVKKFFVRMVLLACADLKPMFRRIEMSLRG